MRLRRSCKDIVENKDFLAKKSQWIFGGDGWAYDIGFGGVDHVSGKLEKTSTSWYSIQKFTPIQVDSLPNLLTTGAIAQFAAGGKETKKKDLACYCNELWLCIRCTDLLWVLTINQTVKAIAEAEAYPGPSLIIAYAPCINHGIKKGMAKAQTEEELAVKCGYWHNFRFNPEAESKFTLDS